MQFEAVEWAERELIDPTTLEPMTLWGNQAVALLEMNPRKALVWARQTGKTLYLVIEALYHATHHGVFQFGDERTSFNILVLNYNEAAHQQYFDLLVQIAELSGIKIDRDAVYGSSRKISVVSDEGSRCDIRGFYPTTKKGGLAAKGLDADLIQVSEANWFKDEMMTSVVLPILYARPSTRVTLASTPVSERGTIFEQLSYRRDFSQLVATAHCRPDWAEVREQIEAEYKEDEWAWRREALAC